MGRKTVFVLAVGVIVGALAGGTMADILGGGSQTGQVLLASVDQEFVPEDNWSGTDWQTRGTVETAAIPVMVSEESWMKDYGND